MTDAPSTSAVAKKGRKTGDADGKNEEKKRFEVKKVRKTKQLAVPLSSGI